MLNIVLYQPEKPANTGNIIRTAMALNATVHIIKPISFSLDEKEFKRAGMDYIKDVDIHIYENVKEFYEINDYPEVFYVTRYSKKTYSSFDFSCVSKDYYFMFGRESSGIPHSILREHEDHLLRIPMTPNARSLNLSNSVAIVLYEAARQQNFFDLATFEAIKGEEFLLKEERKWN